MGKRRFQVAAARRHCRCRVSLQVSLHGGRASGLKGAPFSAGQAPLHCLHAPSIAAAGYDAKVGARLLQHARIEVHLLGCILDDARLLGATCELLAQELQRALAALGWLREDRGRGSRDLRACLRSAFSISLRVFTTVLRLTLAILAIS